MCDKEATTDTTNTNSTPMGLREHSNDHLLKIDTWDTYSTVGAIKKLLAKELPEVKARVEKGESIFKGMKRMNKNPKTPFLFMAFDSEEDRTVALGQLLKITHRGKPWKEGTVTERDKTLTHKGGNKRPREETSGSKLTQYEQYPMEEQLRLKQQHCLSVMRAIMPRRFNQQECEARFQGVVPSPKLEGYRNHVNLSFGRDAQGAPTVGFQTGAMVEGSSTIESAVEEGKTIVTMHPLAKVVAQKVMELVKEFGEAEKGGLTVFDKVSGEGFWRKLQLRHNIKGEVLVDVEVDGNSIGAERLAEVTRRLKEVYEDPQTTAALREVSGLPTAGVVSLQYHCHTGISSLPPDAPRVVLLGAPVLVEYLSGLQYELSPTAFFQVNTEGMERMLEKVQQSADLKPTTTLLDLCSGTGTIGLTLAKHVKRVIGIELVEEAVQNARRNTMMNGIQNAEFHAGRVEHLLPTVIRGLSAEDKEDIVAILDPPRAGVNGTVLKWIRGTRTIRKVVYISCEQKALERDCPAFTKPPTKAYRETPFEVTSAFGVDLFPHTHHVEMVVVLTRQEEEEEKKDEAVIEPPTTEGDGTNENLS